MTLTIHSSGELEKLSLSRLAEIYNQHVSPDKQIRKFSDKETAVRRTLAAVVAHQENTRSTTPPASSAIRPPDAPRGVELTEPEPEKPRAAPRTDLGQRRKRFNLPVAASLTAPWRRESKRGKVISLLTREGGCTIDDIMTEVGLERRSAYEAVRLVHKQHGFGVIEGEDGVIRAEEPKS